MENAMTTITIVDESTAGEKSVWSLDVLDETVSLRELLRRRIYQEVTEYNAKQAGYFHGLVQPTQAERTLNGFRIKTAQKLDWQAQYEKAINAFTRHGYIVLVNEKQIADLDVFLEICAGTEVTFLKLVPLVGG
jgi:glutaredoxin 2